MPGEPPSPMKACRKSFLAALLALAAVPAFAAFESIRIQSDNNPPPFPVTLIGQGITRGHVVVAVSVNETGKLDDWLVLEYSQEALARSAVHALQGWRFTPARLDGQPARATTELRIDFSVEGVVITSNITERFFADMFDNLGERRSAYRPCRPGELDHLPARLAGETPHYATAAEKDGVRGSVDVHFYINEQGEVRLPSVRTGSHPYLMEQAVEAVRTWKFEPPTHQGRPVLVAVAQKFEFGGAK